METEEKVTASDLQNSCNQKESSKQKRKYNKRKTTKDKNVTSSDKIITDSIKDQTITTHNKNIIQGKENKTPRRKPPIQLKKRGQKTKLLLKSDLYVKIQRHVLKSWRDKHRKNIQRPPALQPKSISATANNSESNSLQRISVHHSVGKLTEINDLNPITNADLSSELFASLPQVASHSGSLSPTEAFLMSFPVVSGGGVSGGKLASSEHTEVQLHSTEGISSQNQGMPLMGNIIYSPREEFPSCRIENRLATHTQVENNTPPRELLNKFNCSFDPVGLPVITSSSITSGITTALPMKSFEGITPFSCAMPPAPSSLFDPLFDFAEKLPPFTFSLTTTTTTLGHDQTQSQNTEQQSEKIGGNRNSLQNTNCNLGNNHFTPISVSGKCNILETNSIPNGPSLTTDTKTVNSWSYNNKKLNLFESVEATLVDQSLFPNNDFSNIVPFTFSLTTKASGEHKSATVSSNSNMAMTTSGMTNNSHSGKGEMFSQSSISVASTVFDGYSSGPFNSFPNTFLPPPPPAVHYANLDKTSTTESSNSEQCPGGFSFQLTSPSKAQPVYTSISNQNSTVHNPFSGTTKPHQRASKSLETKKEKNNRKNPSGGSGVSSEKKTVRSSDIVVGATHKSHVNWMTDSMRDYSTEEQFGVVTSNQSYNTYISLPPPPPPPVVVTTGSSGNIHQGNNGRSMFREDFNQKSDIFFAHPPGDDQRYFWGQPTTVETQRHGDYIPQLLPPAPPTVQMTNAVATENPGTGHCGTLNFSTSPGGSGGAKQESSNGKMAVTNRGGDYQSTGNYFSVSNLVAPNKKNNFNSNGSHVTNNATHNQVSSNNSKWKPPPLPANNWELNYNTKGHHEEMLAPAVGNPVQRSGVSKNYSAEALIGTRNNHSGSQSTAITGDLPKSSNKKHCLPNIFSVHERTNPLAEPLETDQLDFNFNTNNTFSIFPNDFIQSHPPPPLFPPPNLPIRTEVMDMGCSPVAAGSKPQHQSKSGGGLQRKKSQLQFDDGIRMQHQHPNQHQSADSVSHHPVYDITGPPSSYFSGSQGTVPVPHPPNPFLTGPEGYSGSPCKLSHSHPLSVSVPPPLPPLDFNAPPATSGMTTNYSTNYLTNFNLSSICPEINNSIH